MLKKQRYLYTTFDFQYDSMIYQCITVFKESEIVFEIHTSRCGKVMGLI